MPLLTLKDLSHSRGLPLFSGLDLSLEKGERLGLVAANGHGKSTLLRLISGEEEPTAGDITRARGLKIAHLAQEIPDDPRPVRELVAEGLGPEAAEYEGWRADVALADLGFSIEAAEGPLSALSGGWQRLAMLARAVVGEPDLLLMDEPTNHLDLARIGALERWVLSAGLTLVIASHDRAFLDAVTTHTLFLRPERSRSFALPYSPALAALDEQDAADGRRFENEMRKASSLRRQAAKLKNIGINSGSDLLLTKTKQLSERAAALEEGARPAHRERGAGLIRLANAGTHAKALVSFDETTVEAPGGRPLYRFGPAWIERGDRVVLMGPNGAGKTQLVNRVLGAIRGEDETIRAAATLVLGHSAQDLGQIDGAGTAFGTINGRFDVGDDRARSLLAGAGLTPDQQKAPLPALSGGQRARLAMLVLRLQQPNFYLLDEPTNHLDIDGQETLQEELLDKEATCLIVSHDRSFIRNVASRLWVIEGRRLVEVEDPEPVFAALLAEG
ncbi:ABC-F family ATP-binding cassette domain-containing protein [Pseudoroseicyclus tamaricis]|uniref:ABC-F family ATP-binding cassette domain-containing protein n=1 Tax=Pseudoroseicyclus tamaricis TaxID=2705421 RepID=A0A6B2K2S2_9RHOB|nr:ABC-F family ATP-binding cassette domain-containing protein [Pseudoroseicyclus tamaricis]NDV02082.1 ABC-F family ATP-binding cassette domain-containing protein [Pseudoroseicyclus tamaricis]